MKKLMYLLVAGSLSVFAACGGASTTEGAATDVAVEEVATDVAVEEVAEAAGCQVEGGTCLADHSCCAPKAAACCCGDATCDGSCHGDAAAAEEAHGDHDHEGHDHE
jgi:hypothetical protein